jgi:hypothetical protein
MGFNICGIRFCPPSFREIGERVSNAVVSVLKEGRIIEFGEYVSKNLRETMEKVGKVFGGSKELLFLAAMSTVAAVLDPWTFFSAMAVGAAANLCFNSISGTIGTPDSIFLEKPYEAFIAQTTLVSVTLGCKAIQSMSTAFFSQRVRDGGVSSIFSGLLAGAALAAYAQKVYFMAVKVFQKPDRVPSPL